MSLRAGEKISSRDHRVGIEPGRRNADDQHHGPKNREEVEPEVTVQLFSSALSLNYSDTLRDSRTNPLRPIASRTRGLRRAESSAGPEPGVPLEGSPGVATAGWQ